VKRLDATIAGLVVESKQAPAIDALMCFRGISVTTSFGLAVEIGDWTRFTGATMGSYLGLTPSEHSSGQTRSEGAITKAGNTYPRKLLIEASWSHSRPTVGRARDCCGRWTRLMRRLGRERSREISDCIVYGRISTLAESDASRRPPRWPESFLDGVGKWLRRCSRTWLVPLVMSCPRSLSKRPWFGSSVHRKSSDNIEGHS